jgi:AmmeMemoRadiSam system protein B
MLQTFEAVEVPGPFDPEILATVRPVAASITPQEVQSLVAHCAANLGALARGATPNYYAAGVSDGTVSGLALTLKPEGGTPVHFFRMALRPGMPLQSTLFSLTEAAATALRSGQIRLPSGKVSLDVTLLFDPAMHGTIREPDLRGFDPQQRALLTMEGGKSAWIFDPSKTPDQLAALLAERANVFNPSHASLFSLAAISSSNAVEFTNAPRAITGSSTRQPAVAGTFYPANPAELDQLVTEYLGEPCVKQQVPAVMVPHAGLKYSGQIAAQVLKQVEIPDTVILIGPKHTRLGVDWAVAPHATWLIPGGQLESDLDLAKELVNAIPGLEFDAAAHMQEHGLEVELPFLAKLAPQTKIVGIVIGAGDLDRCRQFATGLAQVLKSQANRRILLIISRDMNHYASDSENRRLDEIAMQSLERLDPADVYKTVVGQGISMCGVLPAIIVMEAVRQLSGLKQARRVAYATSADATGDTSRVVGYCGMMFS